MEPESKSSATAANEDVEKVRGLHYSSVLHVDTSDHWRSHPINAPPSSPTSSLAHPTSKLMNQAPFDAADELDKLWYAHYYHSEKLIHGKQESQAIEALKQQSVSRSEAADFVLQPEIGLLYAILTVPDVSTQYLKYLIAVSESDSYTNVIGCMQKLVELRFSKLLVSCRSQLLWLVREFMHISVPGIDKVIINLMRYITGGDTSRTTLWLASSIAQILLEHEAWVLSSPSLIPFVFHTFIRAATDHTNTVHVDLLKQELKLCTILWNRRLSDVAQLGRELVRILHDGKDIPGIQALWKQLRSVKDVVPLNAREKANESPSVAQLMLMPTRPKYLAYRLTPRMEEYLLFMMERVQLGYITRYQRWYSMQFLNAPGSEAVIPELIRYVCAVYTPSQQTKPNHKVTPRYHILGWLYLICCKNPTILARAQLAFFFDCLYFQQNDSLVSIEPAFLLMVKSLKSHPSLTLAMLQFLVFAVEKFAASSVNKELMQNGVCTAFRMILKHEIVPSLQPLQSFPLLESNAPELKDELHRLFPEHFPKLSSVENQNVALNYSAVVAHDSPDVRLASPGSTDQGCTGVSSSSDTSDTYSSNASVGGTAYPPTDKKAYASTTSPRHLSVAEITASPQRQTSAEASTLSLSSFLPDRSSVEHDPSTESHHSLLHQLQCSEKELEVPSSLLELGAYEWKRFQDLIPNPGETVPKDFKAAFHVLFQAWLSSANVLDSAQHFGVFIHQLMERNLISARISTSFDSELTCASIFMYIIQQLVQQPSDVYLPVLRVMQERDASISFRLLACCCLDSTSASVDEALRPYACFVEYMDSSFASTIQRDISRTPHIDDARSIATSIFGINKASNAADEMEAVELCILHVIPYLFSCSDHHFLVKVMNRCEAFIEFLAGHATPSMLLKLSVRMSLHEFSLFNHRLTNILLSSLQWSAWKQLTLWDLLLVELQAAKSPAFTKSFLAAARKLLLCADPVEHAETIMCVSKTLIYVTPDASILQCAFKLPESFDDAAIAILSCWIENFPDAVMNYVLVILQTTEIPPQSSRDCELSLLLRKLEILQNARAKRGSDLNLFANNLIVAAIQKILSSSSDSKDKFPALYGRLGPATEEFQGCPVSKKQKTYESDATS